MYVLWYFSMIRACYARVSSLVLFKDTSRYARVSSLVLSSDTSSYARESSLVLFVIRHAMLVYVLWYFSMIRHATLV